MRQLLFALAVCSSLGIASIADAGWGHHRRCCEAPAANYFLMPAAAPQDNSQAALLDSILIRVLEKVISGIPTPGSGSGGSGGSGSGSVGGDFSKIEANLSAISERVENVNTTLRTHGETLVSIDARVGSVEAELKKLRGDVDESSPISKALNEIKTKLTGKTPDQIRAAFLTDEFVQSRLKDAIMDDGKYQNALTTIKAQLEAALKP